MHAIWCEGGNTVLMEKRWRVQQEKRTRWRKMVLVHIYCYWKWAEGKGQSTTGTCRRV
jgi:hypothetical protein